MFRSLKVDNFYYSVAWEPLSRTKLPSFLNINDFLDWDNLKSYKETNIKIPDNESLFFIACMHMTLHSYSRAPHIRLLSDISNIFRIKTDQQKIYDISKKSNTIIRLQSVINIAFSIIGTPKLQNSELSRNVKRISRIITSKNKLKIEPNKLQVLWLEIFV